eukprot:9079657-Pyramimonas_sp.AAC.1
MGSLGKLPEVLATIITAMIPKDEEGGVRPIGILSGSVRCFGKYSRAQADRWERARDRPYHVGSKGRSCERAVWGQAIMMEH